MIPDLVDAAVRGLTRNVAFTSPGAEDPRLAGRTYAIPFEDVWQACLALARGGLRRWEVAEHNDQEGIIRGVARGHLERTTSSITIRITLDPNAQTRVDAMAASRTGRYDLGRNARRLGRFFAALDARLEKGRNADIESLRVDRTAAASTP